MRRRAARLLLPAACLSLLFGGLHVRLTAALFTAQRAPAASTATVDKLANYFAVTPGTVVQPGSSTPVASGGVDTLALAFGTVPKAQSFPSVFTISNVSAQPQTANLSLTGLPQIASAVFASSGGASVTLAPGASTTLDVSTSATVAGRAAGTLRLALAGTSWLYRDYPVTLAEAPEAPASLSAAARAGGRIALSWPASSTSTNLAGYDVYRTSGGGASARLNAAPLGGTSYDDAIPSTVDGTTYTYTIKAVSSDTLPLASLDSASATATADATPPAPPTSVAAGSWINAANASAVAVSVTLPPGSLASDTVTVTLAAGGRTVAKSAAAPAGAGTLLLSGIDASSLPDGTITLGATSTDAAGNVSSATSGGVQKDTVAPAAPSASYSDNRNSSADALAGSAESGATVQVTETAPASGSWTTTAAGGSYSVTVNATSGSNHIPISVGFTVTVSDPAGNASSAAFSFSDTK